MFRKLKKRHLVGSLILGYQVFFDFNKYHTLDWFYSFSEWIGISKPAESYEGPIAWVFFLIFQRAVVHTLVVYFWTGSKTFTHLYGIIESVLFLGMIFLFGLKAMLGDWVFLSFNMFDTFLSLLKSPLLLIIFLPSYFIMNQVKEVE